MDGKGIKELITKALLKEISEEEQKRLDEWLNASGQNKSFFESLYSEEYLKQAMGDRNRLLREKRWNQLKKETVGMRVYKGQLRILRIAAAIILPLMVGSIIWYMTGSVRNQGDIPLAHQDIQVGGSKAVVTLASGQKFCLFGDSTLQVNQGLSMMINRKDTLSFTSRNDTIVKENSFTVISIPRGGEYIVRLEDGTVVHLNSESELRIPVCFTSDRREVWLKGEAYFSVQHETKRQFTVKTDKADISVLGTEFGVRAYDDEQELLTTLVKGLVEVKGGNNVRRIVPGEQAKVNGEGKITVEEVNVEEYIAWILGQIVFVDARLEDIMKELQRWYNFSFSYADPGMKDIRFTMNVTKYKDVTDVFELMEKTGKVSFEVKENEVVLK